MNQESRKRILDRIRSAACPPSDVHRGHPVARETASRVMDAAHDLAVLKKNLESTGSALHVLSDGNELDDTLVRCFRRAEARRVLIFPDEVPGMWQGDNLGALVRREHLPCEVMCTTQSDVRSRDEQARFLDGFDLCVTGCMYLVAEGGVCVIDSASGAGRLASLLPPHHVIVASRAVLLGDLDLLARRLSADGFPVRSSVILVSGPSRTADIEKELVLGVHGPLTLSVILIP